MFIRGSLFRWWIVAFPSLVIGWGIASRIEADPFADGPYQAILETHVDAFGRVDYDGLVRNRLELDELVERIGRVTPRETTIWSRREKMAFYINVHNAIVLRRVIDDYPPTGWSLTLPKVSACHIRGLWKRKKSRVAGEDLTLDAIRREILLEKFKDARIHFALTCAARGGPSLSREAYAGDRLDEQLDRAARRFARDGTKNHVDETEAMVTISPVFRMFRKDFARFKHEIPESNKGFGARKRFAGALGFLALHGEPRVGQYFRVEDFDIEIAEFDWRLNDQASWD